jgi:hypothetical protein
VIEHLLAGYGVEVIYTGQAEDESAESELVRDMLAIVTSFAGRLYGQRSAKTKRLRAAVSAETECGDPLDGARAAPILGVLNYSCLGVSTDGALSDVADTKSEAFTDRGFH